MQNFANIKIHERKKMERREGYAIDSVDERIKAGNGGIKMLRSTETKERNLPCDYTTSTSFSQSISQNYLESAPQQCLQLNIIR